MKMGLVSFRGVPKLDFLPSIVSAGRIAQFPIAVHVLHDLLSIDPVKAPVIKGNVTGN